VKASDIATAGLRLTEAAFLASRIEEMSEFMHQLDFGTPVIRVMVKIPSRGEVCISTEARDTYQNMICNQNYQSFATVAKILGQPALNKLKADLAAIKLSID